MHDFSHIPYPCKPLPALRTNGRTVAQPAPYHMPDRTLTVQELRFTTSTTPSIRLTGQWLLDAGFSPRTRVTVTVAHNKLVIVPAPAQEG